MPKFGFLVAFLNMIPILFWLDWQNPNGVLVKMGLLWFVAIPFAYVAVCVLHLVCVWLPALASAAGKRVRAAPFTVITGFVSLAIFAIWLPNALGIATEPKWQTWTRVGMLSLHASFIPAL